MSETDRQLADGPDEAGRLRALASYDILDSEPEEHFDALARWAARLCDCPMALITLVDHQRQWIKSRVGIDLIESDRSIAFCARTIAGEGLFLVPDAHADPYFARNPFVVGPPHIGFYAGYPLQVAGGHKLGALAVIDRVPRELGAQAAADLRDLARQVSVALEERRLRRQAERGYVKARGQSDSLLAIAGRVARLGAWELDIEQGKVVWSDVVADIHGMPRGFSPELENALAFYVEPDRSRLAAAVERCMTDGSPFDFELVLQPASGGAPCWVRSIGEAVRGPDGRVTRLRGACQDITGRKAEQVERQQLMDLLVAILESVPDPFLAIGADARIRHVNSAFAHLAGREPRALLGQPLEALAADCGLAGALADHCRSALDTRMPVEYVATDAPAGQQLEVRIFPFDDGATVHLRDITQREATLARLRLLDACVRCLDDAVIITDTELDPPGPTIVFANQATQALCGWRPEELIGSSPRRLQGALTQRDRLQALRAALAAGESFETELVNYRRSGEPYWVALKLSAITDETGRRTHFVAVERDITERKAAEEQRLALEQRLLQAQKMESIGTLAGGIAHDFNNILGAILGHARLATECLGAGSEAASSLATITSSAERARSLVEQILAFASRQITRRVSQPLGDLIERSAQLLRSSLPRNIALRAVVPPQKLYALIDSNQLQQVLINLANNAWQALPAEGGVIELGLAPCRGAADPATSACAGGEAAAHLWVRDTGCGMDAAVQARVFEPFFSTKAVGQGTGLGLSAAHGIVAAHGGSIGVQSTVGSGTTFHIHLPVCNPPADSCAEPAIHPPDPGLRGLQVVCVDDDPVMAMTMQALLEREGCEVTSFDRPDAALAHVQAKGKGVDALVTDYNMPGMDGLSLIRELLVCCPGLPVVLASGYMSDQLAEQAAGLGVQALMRKERTVEQLADRLREALRQAAIGARAESGPG